MFHKANNLIGTNCNGLATRLATVVRLPHPLLINREANNICSITHSPGESLRYVIKSSSLEYMKEFLLDMFSYVTWLLWQPRQDVQ